MLENQTFLEAYFNRIGFRGVAESNYATLKAIQEHHVRTIPFESLNPLLKLPVSLDPEDLFQKIIRDKRGGYCFEQNLLFLRALKAIGFKARPLTGRVILKRPKTAITPRTHMLVLVEIDGQEFISDTGFGGQVLPSPIKFITGEPQETRLERYRIINYKNNFILQAEVQRDWRNLYKFDLQQPYEADYKVANWYTSTHPDSHFTSSLTVTLVGKNCRYILHNQEFVIHYLDKKSKKKEIQSPEEALSLLKEVFHLTPPAPELLSSILKEFINSKKYF